MDSDSDSNSDSNSDLDLDSLTDFKKSLKIAELSPTEARLHVAAKFGQFEVIKKLLVDHQKIDMNSRDTEHKTVLHNASSQPMLEDTILNSHIKGKEYVPLLISSEDEEETGGKKLRGILAYMYTTPEVAQLLIDHGAQIGKKSTFKNPD